MLNTSTLRTSSLLYRMKIQKLSDCMAAIACKMRSVPARNTRQFSGIEDEPGYVTAQGKEFCQNAHQEKLSHSEKDKLRESVDAIKNVIFLSSRENEMYSNEDANSKRDFEAILLTEWLNHMGTINDNIIENDPILKADLLNLRKSLNDRSSTLDNWKTFLFHMMKEMQQGLNDDGRMSDESPSAGSDDENNARHLAGHPTLHQIFEEFRKRDFMTERVYPSSIS